jgi:hypothetical protein
VMMLSVPTPASLPDPMCASLASAFLRHWHPLQWQRLLAAL